MTEDSLVECANCGDDVPEEDAVREVGSAELLGVETAADQEDRFFCSLDCVAADMDGDGDA